MTFIPDSDGPSHFCRAFANMVIAWNQVEDQARGLLSSLVQSNGSVAGFVAIRSLGNTSLTTALRASADYEEGPKKEHLLHFLNCMEAHRSYRNYYVHSLTGVGETHDGKGSAGVLLGWDVKGSVHHVQDYVLIEKLVEMGRQLDQLRLYAIRINWALRNRPDHRLYELARKFDSDAWPDKPPVPKTLAKRRRSLRELSSRTQPSPE